jgi:hypothetical protein
MADKYGPCLLEFQGELLDNLPHGQGTMKYAGEITYTSDWVNGEMHGYSRLTLPSSYTSSYYIDFQLNPTPIHNAVVPPFKCQSLHKEFIGSRLLIREES